MAHFAKLDENNIVVNVIVVDNNIETAAGPLGENDMHVDGEIWCKTVLGGTDNTWKQTSYNGNFRGKYAGRGDTYDPAKDKFIEAQRYPSWTLDSNDKWQAPVAYPSTTTFTDNSETFEYTIDWDEDNTRWIGHDNAQWNYWNPDTSSWVAIT
jgi:hypothetical protein|tara:strand:+ start:25 stop:483 length:459 start_codon:yes stop_codon:yes gene_type:complete